jgi:hypothetical protein
MGLPFNGDLIPVTSGFANLGVEVSSNAQNAFDATQGEIRPFNHVHQISGVFHDPLHGQSGVLRFNQNTQAFEVSVDGGLTFATLSAGAGVDSLGVIGDTNLTGNIDLASAANSGFLAIFDTSNASPIQFAVDQLGLSGLWRFPAQGFNGSVVNELVDFHGTTVQGSVTVQGVSGILVDIVGQTVTVGPAAGDGFTTCYVQDFTTASTSWVITHNLNTENINVQLWTGAQAPKSWLIPDKIQSTNQNTVEASFNVAQSGQAIVLACPNT